MCFLKLQEPNQTLENCDKVSDSCGSWYLTTLCQPFIQYLETCLHWSVFIFISTNDLYQCQLYGDCWWFTWFSAENIFYNTLSSLHNYRPWSWMHPVRRLCSEGEKHCFVWRSLTGREMTSSTLFSCILPTRRPRVRYGVVCLWGSNSVYLNLGLLLFSSWWSYSLQTKDDSWIKVNIPSDDSHSEM